MPAEPITLCPLDQCPSGEIHAIDAWIDGEVQSLLIWRDGTTLQAFLNICPHAGRRLDYAPGKFLLQGQRLICAAHGAAFRLSDGSCVSGPCRGQNLQAIAIRLIDGMLCLPCSD